jgi:hypothetical protein
MRPVQRPHRSPPWRLSPRPPVTLDHPPISRASSGVRSRPRRLTARTTSVSRTSASERANTPRWVSRSRTSHPRCEPPRRPGMPARCLLGDAVQGSDKIGWQMISRRHPRPAFAGTRCSGRAHAGMAEGLTRPARCRQPPLNIHPNPSGEKSGRRPPGAVVTIARVDDIVRRAVTRSVRRADGDLYGHPRAARHHDPSRFRVRGGQAPAGSSALRDYPMRCEHSPSG